MRKFEITVPSYIEQILAAREKRANTPLCKPGTHKLRVAGTCGTKTKTLDCKVCPFSIIVPLDARERTLLKAEHKRRDADTKILHGLAWKYQKEFYLFEEHTMDDIKWKAEQARVKRLNKASKKKIFKAHRSYQVHKGFKWTGYELMLRFDKFAKKHPEVTICGCDDSFHACSSIVLIPHRTKETLWGVTVVIVPQMGPFPPTEVFLYPSHSEGLLEALQLIVKEAKIKAKKTAGKTYLPDASIPKGFKAVGL
jgi:hypothetical protein